MHNIMTDVLKGEYTKEQVRTYVYDQVSTHGDRYGTERVEFLPGVCDTYEQAAKRINEADENGVWYGGYAVRFRDYSGAKETKKITELRSKYQETVQAENAYIKEHMPNRVKAEFIGCKGCGSKVSKRYVISPYCPVCHADLRSETIQNRIRAYGKKKNDLQEKIKAEKMKQAKAAKEQWLVKYEYHS